MEYIGNLTNKYILNLIDCWINFSTKVFKNYVNFSYEEKQKIIRAYPWFYHFQTNEIRTINNADLIGDKFFIMQIRELLNASYRQGLIVSKNNSIYAY